MKASVFRGPGKFTVEDLPEPVPTAGQVLLRVDYCGICGTDVHFNEGPPFAIPEQGVILGHEFSGEIVDVGPGVGRERVGEKVAVLHLLPCGRCHYCVSGFENLCLKPDEVVGLGALPGGFAEYVAINQAMAIPLGDEFTTRVGAVIEALAVAHHGVEVSGIQPGQSALVIGCGPIGILTTQVLHAIGVENVVASEITAYRRQMASKLGIATVVNPSEVDLAETLRESAGPLGVEYVFECTGLPGPFTEGLSLLRAAGTMMAIGVGSQPMQITTHQLVTRQHTIKGSLAYSDDYTASKELIRKGLDVEHLISAERGLDDVLPAIEELASGAEQCKVLISPLIK
ncbi:MAG: alcohol dehydrogenase catalytic domain-containing protein [Dehalococcoidia bacterium]|nr:alcohol dehydrogenase catalytic domain-containing protein [Dehalococcoidia bacterium]